MEGEGTYTWPSGVKYVGEWKVSPQLHSLWCPLPLLLTFGARQAGKRHGVGTMYFKDGAKAFTSDWRNDVRVDLDDEEEDEEVAEP